MARLTDARSLRSQKLLGHALLSLIETTPLAQISIRDVTSAAGVSYPTFFRHYSSVQDLLDDLAREEIFSFLNLSDREIVGEQICNFVNERRKLWKILLTTGAASIMREEFIRLAKERAEKRTRLNPSYPAEVIAAFVSGGVFEIVAWWLRGPEDYPAANVARILDNLVIQPSLRPLHPAI